MNRCSVLLQLSSRSPASHLTVTNCLVLLYVLCPVFHDIGIRLHVWGVVHFRTSVTLTLTLTLTLT